jgi:hypothetical protein
MRRSRSSLLMCLHAKALLRLKLVILEAGRDVHCVRGQV